VLVLILTMSVYLSRRYAHTQRDLELQLERVRVLSEERLAQERREHEHLIQKQLLEADLKRRTEELEEARQLQLSMLPQRIPEHPQVVLAAHMTTATEVGGDYYDFDLAEDGTLTLAIGDATGHGMRAGTMVTATKSLFNALGGEHDLVGTVERSNLALKRMNLRALAMALLLARYRDGRLRIAAAGMPSPLVYRAASGAVETIDVSGMPLGSVARFPYRAVDLELHSGDVVLFLSDGFPERGNPSGEQLGYERARARFESLATLAPATLLERLAAAGEEWAQGSELEDDVTFVALAVRRTA
jgi:serine phosphatase RsbU (regulator of sigma subunit)